jgi:hypothetical protein
LDGNNGNGSCICSPGWSGSTCSSCADGYYSSTCVRIPALKALAPANGPDTGGTVIRVTGDNLNSTGRYECSIDGKKVNGTWSSATEVLCLPTPAAIAASSGKYVNFLLLWNSVAVFDIQSPSKTKFFYSGVCPDAQCNIHGSCVLGGCVCDYGWLGTSCTTQQLNVSLAPITNQTIAEGLPLNVVPNLTGGNGVITWSITTNASGLSINTTSGVISWSQAKASLKNFYVTVRVVNTISAASVTFFITVSNTYTCGMANVSTKYSANFNSFNTVRLKIMGKCWLVIDPQQAATNVSGK